MFFLPRGTPRLRANARLIAAAPDLLEACLEAEQKFIELDTAPGPPLAIIYELRRAIAKALDAS